MANNNLRNTIPSTLEECVEPGYTATKLHRWSERIEALGRIVFWILVVVGSIHTIAITAVNAEINEEMAASLSRCTELRKKLTSDEVHYISLGGMEHEQG